jgi:hypothetical protein
MSFRDRYEELFGPVDPYDPIDVGPFGTAKPRRSALPVNSDDPLPSEMPDPLYSPDLSPATPDTDSGFMENVARQFGAGAVQVGEMVAGAGEYVARQNVFLDDIVADTIYGGRRRLGEVREDILSGINEEDLQKAASEILTLDPDRTIWQGSPLDVAEAVTYKFANALPATLVTLLPAARWARAASPGKAVKYMGASEGVMSLGGIQNGIADEIIATPSEQLLEESPFFAQRVEANGGDLDAAKQDLIREAQGLAPIVGGATVAAISSVAGRYFTPIFEKPGAALGSRVARGFAAEAPQEASQGATEQVMQNYSARIYDMDRQLSEGVAEAAAQEGLIGGVMGGGFAGLAGRRPEPPPPPPTPEPEPTPPGPPIDQNARPVISEQPDLPGFEPGGLPGPMPPEGGIQDPAANEQVRGMDTLRENRQLDLREPGMPAPTETSPQRRMTFPVRGEGGFRLERPAGPIPTDLRPLPEDVEQPTTEEGVDLSATSPEEVSRRQFGMDFDATDQTETVTGSTRARTGRFVVEIRNEEGTTDREIFDTVEEAEETADAIANQDPNMFVRVVPETQATSRVRARVQRASTSIEPEYEPTVEEEVANEIRSNVPFEERAGPLSAVRGVESFGQAADRLLGAAEATRAKEEQQRIGGFYNPDRLTFENPDYEQQYRDAWSQLVDAELMIEMSNQKQAVERAKKRRQNLLKELGKIRQVARPKVSETGGAKFIRAAKAVNPAETRNRTTSEVNETAAYRELKDAETDVANIQKAIRSLYLSVVRGIEARDQKESAPKSAEKGMSFKEQLQAVKEKLQRDKAEVFEGDQQLRERVTTRLQDLRKSLEDAEDRLAVAEKRIDGLPSKYGSALTPRQEEPDYLGEFEARDRTDIDALEGRALDEEFERAVRFREGRERRVPTTTKTRSRGRDLVDEGEVKFKQTKKERDRERIEAKRAEGEAEEAAQRKAASKKKSERAGDTPAPITGQEATFDDITEEGEIVDAPEPELGDLSEVDTGGPRDYRAENPRPSDKRRFIRREAEQKRRQDTGQYTKKGATVRVRDKAGRPKTVETKALTREDRKMDESVSDRLKREEAAKKANAEVGKAATRAKRTLKKLQNVTPEDKWRSGFLYAKRYLAELIQFAESLKAAKQDTADAIKLADNIAATLDTAGELSPQDFAQKWGVLARRNDYENLKALRNTSLEGLRDRDKAARDAKKQAGRVRSAVRSAQMNEQLRSDSLYQALVAPVMKKMSQYIADSVEGRVVEPYIPTEAEIAEIRYAMQTYKNTWKATRDPEIFDDIEYNWTLNRKELYGELKAILQRSGFQFDENGNVSGFDATEAYFNVGEKAKRGNVKPPPPTASAIDREMRRNEIRKEEQAKEERSDASSAANKYDKVNGLIEQFKARTAAKKTTINGIKRQEERFIRGLKKLGVWTETSAGLGTININGYSIKTYRRVGPRLDSKALRKDAAREQIQKLRTLPIPRAVAPFVKRVRTPEFAAGVERFLSENDTELFIESAGPVKYDSEYTGVADALRTFLNEGAVDARTVLETILQIAPENTFYHQVASRLANYNLDNISIEFGAGGDFRSGVLGSYRRRESLVLLNRDALNIENLQGDEAYGARVVHTVTHELLHAVTHKAIDNRPELRQYFESLQARARQVWQDTVGGPLPYGLKILEKRQNQAHEFIAEAFSNHEFQNFLEDTRVEPDSRFSLWKALVNVVRDLLNLPSNPPNNIFDAILLTEDVLFDDIGIGGEIEVVEGDLNMIGDGVVDNVTSIVNDSYKKSMSWFDRAKNASRNLLTFEQLRDMYTKYFDDMEGGNGLTRYMDAWARRNSSVSKYMKEPEDLSTRWTQLEANSPEQALEISRLGTEATMYRMTPSKALTNKERGDISPTRLAKFDELRARYKAMSPEARALYDDLAGWYKSSAADESRLLLSASLRGILTKGKTSVMTSEEYQNRFTPEVIDRMKDEESIREELVDLVPEDELGDFVKELTRMAALRTIGYGDYFPLMRYGDYVVYAETKRPDEMFDNRKDAYGRRKELLQEDPTLDVGVIEKAGQFYVRTVEKAFYMHESKSEAEATRAEIKKDYDYVSDVQAKISRDTEETAINSNAALDSILRTLSGNPAAQAAIKNHYLRSLSDSAFRKRELKRQNRRGVDYDVQHRNLANYLKQSAYYRAQLKHGWKMGEALQDMVLYTRKRPDTPEMSTEQLQQVVKNIQYRDQMTYDPTELNRLVKSGVNLTQFMMLTSPSYWMINATQPWLVTAPIMGGRHGMGSSYAALKDAMMMVKTPLTQEALQSWGGLKAITDKQAGNKAFNVIDQLFEHLKANGREDYIELIDELRDQNIIDINVLTELREIAEGVEDKLSTRVLDASRILAHITEVNNRVVTAIAAYNLELNKTGDKAAAKKYAADMISQTQFNYSTQNKPPLFQSEGPLKWAAPLMFQFMQWPQHMYALLIRNVHASVKGASPEDRAMARKSLMGLLGTHLAVGGTIGMALQPIKWALGMVMFAFGDDDEPYTIANAINGRTFDNMMTETMTDLFGSKMGGAAARGLPTLIGTDLSGRMSMGTLYFVDLRGDTAESIVGSLMASFGGATLNQALNWGNALGKIASGDVYRGIEQGMPKIVRDGMRAGRYYNDGLVNNAGDTVIPAKDLSFGEIFLQGIGFQPDEVSKFYQGQAAIKGAQGYARDRRERLIRRYIDEGADGDVLREVLEFNRAFPSLKITRSTLIRGARSQIERETRYGRYGANIDEQEARDFAEYGEPYR